MKIGIALLVVGFVLVLFFGIRSQTDTKINYQITGIVLDDKGNPLVNARVSAVHMTRPIKGRLPNGYTDEEGRFTISDLEASRYSVMVENEKEGYADFTSIAYKSVFEFAEPTTEKPSAHLAIRMGERASRVLGKMDKANDTKIKICLTDGRCSFASPDDDGNFDVLTPTDQEFSFSVETPDYKEFKFSDKDINGVKRETLKLKSGEKYHLKISLKKK